jgi:hypothetical protein
MTDKLTGAIETLCFYCGAESVVDAVDGSSTGTGVPRIWGLLRLPGFGGAKHANDQDDWSGYREVGFPGSRR